MCSLYLPRKIAIVCANFWSRWCRAPKESRSRLSLARLPTKHTRATNDYIRAAGSLATNRVHPRTTVSAGTSPRLVNEEGQLSGWRAVVPAHRERGRALGVRRFADADRPARTTRLHDLSALRDDHRPPLDQSPRRHPRTLHQRPPHQFVIPDHLSHRFAWAQARTFFGELRDGLFDGAVNGIEALPSALFAAVTHLVPTALPLLAPSDRSTAARTNFVWRRHAISLAHRAPGG